MVNDYVRLTDQLLRNSVFHGLEEDVHKIRLLLSDDMKESTLYNYLGTLKKYVEFMRGHGQSDPLRFDPVHAREFLNGYKATSRFAYAMRLRKMFRLNGETVKLKVRRATNELPPPLSDQDLEQIFKATTSLKWRCIFKLTYEGALRKHEVLGMKVKHVRFDKFGAEVWIPSTKSQALWLRIIDSVPILQMWFEQHPDKDNREAWLFPGRVEGNAVTASAFWYMLRDVARRVGVKKRLFPHLLRHSRLAWLKKHGAKIGISDSVICKLYGRWSGRNAHVMLDRYGRIDPAEANELILRAYNKLGKEKVQESLSKPRACPRCHIENDSLSKYCRVCGMVLNEKEAVLLMERESEDEALKRKFELFMLESKQKWENLDKTK